MNTKIIHVEFDFPVGPKKDTPEYEDRYRRYVSSMLGCWQALLDPRKETASELIARAIEEGKVDPLIVFQFGICPFIDAVQEANKRVLDSILPDGDSL